MTPANSQTGQRLDEILARDVVIQWAEAVALVQGACRQSLVTGASGFPTPAQIVLSPEGTVVANATADQTPVPGAGHLLAALLGDDVPVRLRLLASQATGANAHASLQEFSEALAYFERPDPEAILRELYRRAAAAPQTGRTVAPATPPAAEPREALAPGKARNFRRWPVAVAAAALLCVLGWVIGTRLGEIRAVVADVAQETVGEPAAESSSAAVNGSSERPTPRASTSSTAKSGSRPGAASTFALPAGNPGVVITATEPLDTELDTPPAVVDGDLDAPEIDVDDVYTKGDPDVIPPQSVYPKLPSERAGRTAPGRTVLELLISAEGFVEHVRLRTPPRDVHEFMLVSAAKAWRFDPATVNGRPVRFLHTVSITRLE